MRLMDTDTQNQVRDLLSAVQSPVTIHLFTQEFECGYCKETRQIAEEVAELSDHVTLQVHDFVKDQALAEAMGIDKIPALAINGENDRDYGIRFYGIPSGYEFTSLLEAILAVGTGEHDLDAATIAYLDSLETPLHLQVFVTPTCPYCPQAVVLAHRMALASDKVRADMVEVTEFPHLGQRYEVMGVPRTVINEETYLEGAAPEKMLLDKVKDAVALSARSSAR
ncbi:MAG TPA: thioredoxin family protein [Aggregatilineaceae bacterium]|jgi:glutaredoxin-like protein|nr:thioredoxin family protein [Anaerolineae bacterium]HMM27401.1 thioredoxin family protein [Aggregatilineaceae bacterium]